MTVLVVCGTQPRVGETTTTAAVAAVTRGRGASCAVVKPAQPGVADGAPGDLAEVQRLSGVTDVHELVRYEQALSPAAAARLSGRPALDLAAFVQLVLRLDAEHDLVLVEGVGGLLVRLDEDGLTLAELARSVRAPVLLVAGVARGALGSVALTLEVMAHRGVELTGVVVGAWPAEPTLAERADLRDLETLAARPLAGALPLGVGQGSGEEFLPVVREALGPALGGSFSASAFRSRYAL